MQKAQYELHANVEDRHWWFVARRNIVKRLLNRVLPPRPDALVIDVGCGTGANIAALSDSYRCLGLDHSQNAIDLARTKFPAVEYERQADIAAYTTQFQSASAVLLMDVLEHVRDDFQLLSQILSLLQPGAHVLITVPADPSLWSEHDENFGHWRRYQRDRLRAAWQGLPVEERLLSHYNARLYPMVKAVRTLGNMRRGRKGNATVNPNANNDGAGTDFAMPPGPVNDLLRQLFQGEGNALDRNIDRNVSGYGRGVSLIAILRRTDGPLAPRTKPAGLPPDQFTPA